MLQSASNLGNTLKCFPVCCRRLPDITLEDPPKRCRVFVSDRNPNLVNRKRVGFQYLLYFLYPERLHIFDRRESCHYPKAAREGGGIQAGTLDQPRIPAKRALRMALDTCEPCAGLVHHTDRGSQYPVKDYRKLLKARGITCSMSRKGNCWERQRRRRELLRDLESRIRSRDLVPYTSSGDP
ncbi:MAG: hypothetical protein ACI9W2_002743 [Gammaproteobacteria bacterium]|jgi:hypothetical protein